MSDVLADMLSHSMGCLFILLMFSFAVQMADSFKRQIPEILLIYSLGTQFTHFLGSFWNGHSF